MSSVIGIDEAGRGPWAGPVVASAVYFGASKGIEKIRYLLGDSKKLTKKKREFIFEKLMRLSESKEIIIGIGRSGNEIIDTKGIKEANRLAMKSALEELIMQLKKIRGLKIIIDGRDNYKFEQIKIPVEFLVRGDSLIDEIKAASIIAKVTRDSVMDAYDETYPGYHFKSHSGYGTKKHQDAIAMLGICDIHRKSFKPIKNILI